LCQKSSTSSRTAGDCGDFATIDQKIEIEKKKKELYEELFKTMLNKIMSQEIDINLLDY
jgi:hypothetical protein